MGKKRDKANKNIETLVNELVGYMGSYVGRCNCPYTFNLFGTKGINEPKDCNLVGCERCKEDFYAQLNTKLLDDYIVE